MHDSAARAPRGGRERRVGLRKPVVVRRARRTADPHSGGLLDGPIGFPKAHPSLPPGERAVRVRTEVPTSVALRLQVFHAMLTKIVALGSALAFILGLAVPVSAGAPTDQIRQKVDEVVRVLDDPALKSKPAERHA